MKRKNLKPGQEQSPNKGLPPLAKAPTPPQLAETPLRSRWVDYVRMLDDNRRKRGFVTGERCTLVGHHLHLNRQHMRNLRKRTDLGNVATELPVEVLLGIPVFLGDGPEPVEHNAPERRSEYLRFVLDHWTKP